jgi:hypothetical protein
MRFLSRSFRLLGFRFPPVVEASGQEVHRPGQVPPIRGKRVHGMGLNASIHDEESSTIRL